MPLLDHSWNYAAYAVRVYIVFESTTRGMWHLYLYETCHAFIRSYVVQWHIIVWCIQNAHTLPDLSKEGNMNADDVANHLTSLVRRRMSGLVGATGRCYGIEVSNLGVG